MSEKLHFYHSTTRKLVTIFGALFDEMYINLDDTKELYKIPLTFAPKEKFLALLTENPDPYSSVNQKNVNIMSYELLGLSYAAERATHNLNKIKGNKAEGDYILNRVPYDLSFNLYISSKQMEHSFKIIEQIIPMFKPAYNITIDEMKENGFIFNTDISVTLDSLSPEIDVYSNMTDQRVILWTLGFTMKAWYYPRVERSKLIKESIINIFSSQEVENEYWLKFTSEVKPRNAKKTDNYEIVDSVKDMTGEIK